MCMTIIAFHLLYNLPVTDSESRLITAFQVIDLQFCIRCLQYNTMNDEFDDGANDGQSLLPPVFFQVALLAEKW